MLLETDRTQNYTYVTCTDTHTNTGRQTIPTERCSENKEGGHRDKEGKKRRKMKQGRPRGRKEGRNMRDRRREGGMKGENNVECKKERAGGKGRKNMEKGKK